MITPVISPAIFELRPDFAALSIEVVGARNAASDAHSTELLRHACVHIDDMPWAEGHLDAWRAAYRVFGAKPQRTPSSADALRKRARRDGTLASSNAVVDLYNAISLRYALPIGGEDAAAYAGAPHLLVASGGEAFDTVQDGLPRTELVDAGEVIWRDERGVTCRRWNWRQGIRTRITDSSTSMWFVLERLEPMPLNVLRQAGAELIAGLKRLSPALKSNVELLSARR